jgi:hypothetical protein
MRYDGRNNPYDEQVGLALTHCELERRAMTICRDAVA